MNLGLLAAFVSGFVWFTQPNKPRAWRIDKLPIVFWAWQNDTPNQLEVQRAIKGIKLAAEHISQIKGEQIPMALTESSQNRLAFTTKEPIGIVAAISAFNHPLNLAVHQIATAFAAGCPVIFKPAQRQNSME